MRDRIEKTVLVPERVRHPPKEGFAWMDRRLVRDGWIERLTSDELVLYVFLACVADREGLSYYSHARIERTLKLPAGALVSARATLVERGLLAYRAPLYQVLELPAPPPEERRGLRSVREVLGEILARRPSPEDR